MAEWALAASLVACGLAVAAFVAVVRLRRLLGSRPGRGHLHQDDELLREAWLEEIEARGQAVLAQIAQAEERWRQMQREGQAGMYAPGASGPVGGTAAGAGGPSPGTGTPRDAQDTSDDGLAEVVGGRRMEGAGAPRGATSSGMAKAAVAAQVRLLAAKGLDAAAIARQLGIGVGEVELILNLPQPDRG